MSTIGVNLRMVGTEPLLMHSVQAADPQNKWAKDIREITDKKTRKTAADEIELSRLKYMSSLYWTAERGIHLPGENIFRCLIEAGAMTRDGKNVERALTILTPWSPLEYDGPRTGAELWGDGTGRFVDRRMAAVARVRIPVVRPIFTEWAASFDFLIEDEIIDLSRFKTIAEKAGRMIGVGDYRRFYGKFDAAVTLTD